MIFQYNGQLINLLGNRTLPAGMIEGFLINIFNIRMCKMGLGNQVASFRRPIQFTGKIIAGKPFLLKNVSPFFDFQLYTVCPGDPVGDKGNIFEIRNRLEILHFRPL